MACSAKYHRYSTVSDGDTHDENPKSTSLPLHSSLSTRIVQYTQVICEKTEQYSLQMSVQNATYFHDHDDSSRSSIYACLDTTKSWTVCRTGSHVLIAVRSLAIQTKEHTRLSFIRQAASEQLALLETRRDETRGQESRNPFHRRTAVASPFFEKRTAPYPPEPLCFEPPPAGDVHILLRPQQEERWVARLDGM